MLGAKEDQTFSDSQSKAGEGKQAWWGLRLSREAILGESESGRQPSEEQSRHIPPRVRLVTYTVGGELLPRQKSPGAGAD